MTQSSITPYSPRSVLDPNGYGNGVAYYNGGDANLTVLYGATHVADCLLCRLSCSGLWYDSTNSFGYNLQQLLNFTSPQTAQSIASRARQEVLKDQRVQSCSAVGSTDGAGDYTITLTIVLQPGGETFNLIGSPIAGYAVNFLPDVP